jgi:hypothetical protein
MHAFMPSPISQLVARHACEVNDDGSSTSKVSSKTNGRPKNGRVILAATTRTLCMPIKGSTDLGWSVSYHEHTGLVHVARL